MKLKIGSLSLTDGVLLRTSRFTPGSEMATTEKVGTRIDLDFMGSRATITNTIETINRLLQQAALSQEDRTIEKVYLEGDSGGGYWRSEIVSGVLDVGKNFYDKIGVGYPDASLLITRRNWWEGAEQTLPIGNVNNGVVYNCNDLTGTAPAKRTNALYITGNMIEGDLPTPCTLTINNTSEDKLGVLWIGVNNTRSDWFGNWMLEAENATGITPVSDASASGGAYAKGTLTYGQALPILSWALSSALVNQMRGQRVRILLRPHYSATYANFKYKIKIKHGTITVYETDWVRESELVARHWLDLFDLRLPPWLEGATNLDALTLELHATPTHAGTWTWAFDDIMFFPQDSFVVLSANVPADEGVLVINGDRGWVLDNPTDANKYGLRSMVGSLMLKPRAGHTFLFAMHTTYLDNAPIDMTLDVTGKYRARRLTL